MAKDQKETTPDTSNSPPKPEAAQAAPASVASLIETAVPAPPAPPKAATKPPTCAELVAAIKSTGAALTAPERNELICTVAALPEATAAVSPNPYDGRDFKFRVSWGELAAEVVAKNPREAWAVFCDQTKNYPSPKSGKVECLGVKEAA